MLDVNTYFKAVSPPAIVQYDKKINQFKALICHRVISRKGFKAKKCLHK